MNTNNAKVVTPDELNIIFGNSELRVKAGDKIAFSNLGLVNAHYNSKDQKKTVDDLLGAGKKKEVLINNYEFYQLFFEEE